MLKKILRRSENQNSTTMIGKMKQNTYNDKGTKVNQPNEKLITEL